ncbi:MAG: BMC domain-containing protein [Rhodothermaceae bacterium]
MNQALGLLETKGLIGAIEAADAMAKAADITIVSKEKSTAALVTIKITGDTSAVRAALDAGAVAAESIGQLISVHLIPSPDDQIEYLITNTEKIAVKPGEDNFEEKIEEPVVETVEEEPKVEETAEEESSETAEEESSETAEEESSEIAAEEEQETVTAPEEIVEEVVEEPEPEVVSEADFAADDKNLFENFAEKEEEAEPEAETPSEAVIDVPIEEKEEFPEEENLFGMEEEEETVIIDGANIPPMEELENLSVPELRKLARSVENFPIKGREISKANKQILLSYFKML